MIVASHDRYLVERVTDTAYGMFGDGRLVHLPGGVDEYLARTASSAPVRRRRRPPTRTGRACRPAISAPPARSWPGSNGSSPSWTEREVKLNESLAEHGSDYDKIIELEAQLKAVQDERGQVEEAWLELAERVPDELIRGCSCAAAGGYARIGAEDHTRRWRRTPWRTIRSTTRCGRSTAPSAPSPASTSSLFGIVGLIVTAGNGLFGQPDDRVLGQGANLFWSIVSLIARRDRAGRRRRSAATSTSRSTSTSAGACWWSARYELATSRTDANFLKFTISTVVVTYLVGLVLITAGLYSKIGHRGGGQRPAARQASGRPA